MTTRKANEATYNLIMTGQLLEQRQMEVYHTLFHCGPIGKTVLNQMCAQMSGTELSSAWSDQLAKMFGLGLLVWIGKVACPNTGVVEDVWDVTGTLPKDKPDDAMTSADVQAQQQIPGTEAPVTTTTTSTKPLKDSKPKPKKLKEAVDYIAMAVKVMAADTGEEIPEIVQHTLRWLRKPIERTRKKKDNSQGAGDTAQQQT